MPTSHNPDPEVLRAAVGLVTCWLSRDTPGLPSLTSEVAAALDNHPASDLLGAEAMIAAGVLRGVEMAIDHLLQDPPLLARVVESRMKGQPMKAKDLGLDRFSVLHRIGASAGHL